ncbi:MAG: HD domain-containing protein [Pseudomonadota bacterium]
MQATKGPRAAVPWRSAWRFAAVCHAAQHVPGSPANYLGHIGDVVLELISAHVEMPLDDLDLAVQCAILHDTVEDQDVTAAELEGMFGAAVANGVLALSKSPALPKTEAMQDSLQRIRQQPYAVWCVKLADRISNLQSAPPHWSDEKCATYRLEAQTIREALGDAHSVLAARLDAAISAYPPVEGPGGF